MSDCTKTTGAASLIAMLAMVFVANPCGAESFSWQPTLTTTEETARLAWQLAPRVQFVLERRSEYEGAPHESARIDTRALLQVTWKLPRRRR
jgi:hypothetical protein